VNSQLDGRQRQRIVSQQHNKHARLDGRELMMCFQADRINDEQRASMRVVRKQRNKHPRLDGREMMMRSSTTDAMLISKKSMCVRGSEV